MAIALRHIERCQYRPRLSKGTLRIGSVQEIRVLAVCL